MSSIQGCRGVYAVDWAQTLTGDERAIDLNLLVPGLSWRWQGEVLRLDGGAPLLWLDSPVQRIDPRARARARALRLAPLPGERAPLPMAAPHSAPVSDLPEGSMALTDGARVYLARILRLPGRVLAVFDPLLPPPGRDLWITALNLGAGPAAKPGVICFLPGTPIETETGWRAVETLQPGDRLMTRDNGAQPLIWRDETRLSGAELFLYPHLRPVRLRRGALGGDCPERDLLVSPGHRVLTRAPDALFGGGEVLITARDLIGAPGVGWDFTLDSVTYIHLMLPRHEILNAAGLGCDSFHPALADAALLKRHARTLERALPGITRRPETYGACARRCLEPAEAAVLARALA